MLKPLRKISMTGVTLVILVVITSVPSANAAFIYSHTEIGNGDGSFNLCQQSTSCLYSGPLSSFYNVTIGFGTGSIAASASSPDSLHGYGVMSASLNDMSYYSVDIHGDAYVRVSEPLVYTTDRNVRYINVRGSVAGVISSDFLATSSGGTAVLSLINNNDNSSCEAVLDYGATIAICTLSNVPFSVNQPFNFDTVLGFDVGATATHSSNPATASVDVSHTGQVFITPLDSNFNVVPGAQIFDSDGFQFQPYVATVETPEPATFNIALICLSALGIRMLGRAKYRKSGRSPYAACTNANTQNG